MTYCEAEPMACSYPKCLCGVCSSEAMKAHGGLYNMRGGQGSYPCWAVRIDRRTKWGNPFVIGKDGTREGVIAKYEAWLRSQPELVAAVKRELRGKDLLCWCHPLLCHGDVLLMIANERSDGDPHAEGEKK